MHKPGKHNETERVQMQAHVIKGYEISQNAGIEDEVALNIVLYHHEKFDGKGYPFNKRSKEIPLEARIVAIVDAFDAMTSVRCYQDRSKVKTKEQALAELEQCKGTHFDPDIVDFILEKFRTDPDYFRVQKFEGTEEVYGED